MPITLPSLPSWSTTKETSKQGFDKVYNIVDKLGAPVNKLSNKLGSEAFWPTTLDKESDKAARILRSFCKDGFYVEQEAHEASGGKPSGKQKVIKKIPTEVIQKAKGLAIFTTMRTGLWISGAGGSGILVARKEDGSWSPPSGILLHTAGLGFLVGVDIYDCVVVINTEKALQAFTKIRATLGGEISAVAGPVGIGGILETELHKRQAPVFNYLKSRGFYAGVQIDGTVIIERQDENERFYGEKLSVENILAGKVRYVPYETRTLMATIKAAQGDIVDETMLPNAEPTPGDFEVSEDQGSGFGLPPADDDPDPYGVRALQQEGMEIKEITETGQITRPSIEAFEYKPSPSSPIFATFNRNSRRLSKRDSGGLSIASTDRGTQTEHMPDSPSLAESSTEERSHSPVKKTSQNLAEEVEDDESVHEQLDHADPAQEMPVIQKAKLVSIPKRIPPALPPRSPYRNSGPRSAGLDGPRSPSIHEPQGEDLGINLTRPLEDHPDRQTQPLPLSPLRNESLEAKLNEVHLSSGHDSERLSPRKDGFDEISMSGSDYSHETPAEHTSIAEPTEAPIKMEDNEPDHPLAVDTGTGKKEQWKIAAHEDDEFHSIPNTPLEVTSPPLEHARAYEEKVEDFS
ncbi:SH3 domain-containing YSC84-like protein 1, partial [Lecanoromycetidae sp. Uapishka_2]